MRTRVLVCLLVVAATVSVLLYTRVSGERELQRLIARGDDAVRAGEAFLAIEAYSGALALDSDSMALHLKRGETYQQHGDLEAAQRDLTAAVELDPSASRPHERLGDVTFALGRIEAAMRHYADYVRLDDQNPRVQYKLGLASLRMGALDPAVTALQQAIALDPGFSEAHYLLGLALRDQGDNEAARAALDAAVRLAPGFLEARAALATVHHALGEQRDELRQLDALAALDREHPSWHVTRGLAYARAGDTEMAVLALGRAAEEYPDQPMVYGALGRIWLEIAEAEDDRTALGKALEALASIPRATASSASLTLLGRALTLSGDLDDARQAFVDAIERLPVDPLAFSYLAALEADAGRGDVAAQLRQRRDVLLPPPDAAAMLSP